MRKLMLALITLTGFQASCSESADVEQAIAAQVTRGAGTVLDMRTAAPFEWSRLYVFPPYTQPEEITEALGFSWSGARRSGIESSDAINLLVFVNGGRVVESVELPRGSGDFYKAGRAQGFAADSALFQVRQEGLLMSGAPCWVLYPAP